MRGNFKTNRIGVNNPNYKDGRKRTRLYSIYYHMLSRCYNSNTDYYYRYGARGITVCEEWRKSFDAFYEWAINNGYDDTLTIDRKDVNGNYEPSNCRWATAKEQANNRSTNHNVTLNDETKTLTEWCLVYSINYRTVRDRLKRGWNYEKALTTPVDTRFKKKVIC